MLCHKTSKGVQCLLFQQLWVLQGFAHQITVAVAIENTIPVLIFYRSLSGPQISQGLGVMINDTRYGVTVQVLYG